jgi:arsenite methyltransferase
VVHYNLDSRELAEKYDELSESQFENGKRLLDRLGINTGQSVLDIGAGTGRLGFYVLEQIGPRGRFLGIDPLPSASASPPSTTASPTPSSWSPRPRI